MNKPAIQVQHLGKEYILGGAEQQYSSFRELLTGALTAPLRKLRKLGGETRDEERFWALKDVGFEVVPGEVLGIIGRNGAGKSTLLKILSRITAPTEGRVVTRGRVASLLEVGTGFHPELTGRENILLNGAILGMGRREILSKFDEIVTFAEIEKFLETPVKRYSSGMYVRLAFAVAAHLEPEILLVDEVLAVGDTEFQKKCVGKMSGFADSGRTVLFVSHNLSVVRRLCSRVVVLNKGLLELDAPVDQSIEHYLSTSSAIGAAGPIPGLNGPLKDSVVFESITIVNGRGAQKVITVNDPITIVLRGRCESTFRDLEVAIGLSSQGLRICSAHDVQSDMPMRRGGFESTFSIAEGQLRPGRYMLSFGAHRRGRSEWAWIEDAALIDIENDSPDRKTERDTGVVLLRYETERRQLGP